MREGFRTDQDIYSRDCAAWSRDDLYACNRWISRVVCKAPGKPSYASILRKLNIAAMNEPSRVFLRCALKDVPAARPFLSPEALADLDRQEPPAVPYVLTDGGTPIMTHAADGLVL